MQCTLFQAYHTAQAVFSFWTTVLNEEKGRNQCHPHAEHSTVWEEADVVGPAVALFLLGIERGHSS